MERSRLWMSSSWALDEVTGGEWDGGGRDDSA